MNRNFKTATLSFLLLVGGLSGCASQVAVVEGFRPSDEASRLQVVDTRPEKEKTSEILSLSITSCDYGIRRLGDETTNPSRLVLLQSDLAHGLRNAVYGKTLTISHYTIHYNNGSAQRRGIYGTTPGVIGAVMQGMGSNCPKEKTSEGWYAGTELNRPNSPIIIEIEAKIDGETHSVRSVYAPAKDFGGRFGDADAARELFEAINRAHVALAESIKRRSGRD